MANVVASDLHATEWRLTEFQFDITHDLASKEFARWTPEIQNSIPSQTSTVPAAGHSVVYQVGSL
jgi:hypothetical protein